jgi:hypothetical protein
VMTATRSSCRHRALALRVLWLVTLLAGAWVAAASPAGAWPDCAPRWIVAASPNAGPADNTLAAGAALAPNDVWAAGSYRALYANQTLALHYDGVQWSIFPTPNITTTTDQQLTGLAAPGPGDIWAVGSYVLPYSLRERTLILHYDGTAWSAVASPNASADNNALTAVTAVAPGDVWAAGYALDVNTYRPLLSHYDGAAWSAQLGPSAGSGHHVLRAIAALASDDVWAVGEYFDGATWRTLALHFDGTTWTVVPTPNTGSDHNALAGVAGNSGTDVWAVGYAVVAGAYQTLLLHYDGTAWSVAPGAGAGPGHRLLHAVAALAPDDVWAGGVSLDVNGLPAGELLEHWDGQAWQVVDTQSGLSGDLRSLTAAPSGDVYAAGVVAPAGSSNRTLVETRITLCTRLAFPLVLR